MEILYFIFVLVASTIVLYSYKKIKLRKYTLPGYVYKDIIAGSVNILTHSPNNLDFVKSNFFDTVALGPVFDSGFDIDRFEILFYEDYFVVYRKPTIFILLTFLTELIPKRDAIKIPYSAVLSWYADEERGHVGIKIFLEDKKKDLLACLFVPGDQVKSILEQKVPAKFSQEHFIEPNSEEAINLRKPRNN